MNDLEQRVKTLETKVKVLEETLETLKNMSLSEQMGSFIQSRQKSLRMVELLNSVSDDDGLDFEKERVSLEDVRKAKQNVDDQIAQVLKSVGTFSEDFPDDPRYFNYEIEDGYTTDYFGHKNRIPEMQQFVGKTIRITSYNGFESNRVIVPKEIDGYTVVSIGVNAFKNATLSEIILPKTIKAVLFDAFEGCKELKQIDLPDGLLYVGEHAFQGSGIETIVFPDTVTILHNNCCNSCVNLKTVAIGNGVKEIGYSAFSDCRELTHLSIPENVEKIGSSTFKGVPLRMVLFPKGVKSISHKIFGDHYYKRRDKVVCVFLGTDTIIDRGSNNYDPFYDVELIYCLPGSNVQKFAREQKIQMKPLSDFRMEDYQ